MKISYLLNGTQVNPVKREDIYLEVNHDQEAIINQPRPHVGINNLYFTREDVKQIMLALNAAPGITEGVPFDIVISERGKSSTIQMYLDLMEGLQRSNDGIVPAVKMLQSLDWLEDKVDAFTFESLYNETNTGNFSVDGKNYGSYKQFFDEKIIYIPYVISTIPNSRDAFLALFSAIFIIVQLVELISKAKDLFAELEGLNFWGYLVLLLKVGLYIAYAALLIAALVEVVKMMINALIQPLKYHGAMLMSDLLKITAVKLGLQAQSSIWDDYPYNQVAFMPEKYNPPEEDPVSFSAFGLSMGSYTPTGYTSPDPVQRGYFNGVGGDFLRLIKSFCNGKIIIPDQTNVLQLERADFYPANTPYQLPDIRMDWNGYNTDELIATTIISFTRDLNDKNCIDNYTGTKLQATHQQVSTINKSLVNLKGLREINIAAARGIRKEKLTAIEELVENIVTFMKDQIDVINGLVAFGIITWNGAIFLVNGLILVWNAIVFVIATIVNTVNLIIAFINGLGASITPIPVESYMDLFIDPIQPLPPFNHYSMDDFVIEERIGALLLENDMVDVPKLLLVDTTSPVFTSDRIAYVHADNQKTINAQNLWNKFYFIDAFVGTVNNRRTKIVPALNSPEEKNRVMLSLADFKNLVSNPQFEDQFGEKVIADSIQWYIEQNGAAQFDFKKAGWLRDPQNKNGIKRAQEIAINLKLQITVPNGQ